MKHLKILLLSLLVSVPTVHAQAQRGMVRWVGKYPDSKFFIQPQIARPLRRILTKADYASIRDYNLMIPIKRVGDYLVTYATMKYSDPLEALSLAFNLKTNAVYVVFLKGEEHRKFSTTNNQFNLPDDVLEELGLKEE